MSSFPPTTRWTRRWTLAGSTSPSQASESTIASPGDFPRVPKWASASWGLFSRGRLALYSATLAVSGLSACASMPSAPTPEMTRAESAIEQAQRAGAAEFAAEPLEAAQRNLSAAKVAVSQRDNAHAAQLVDEAYADARLADYTAQSEKSGKAAAEIDKSIRTLENETNRPRSP